MYTVCTYKRCVRRYVGTCTYISTYITYVYTYMLYSICTLSIYVQYSYNNEMILKSGLTIVCHEAKNKEQYVHVRIIYIQYMYVHVALLKNLQALQLSCYKSYHLHTCSYRIHSRFFKGKLIIFGCKNFIA